MRGPVRRLGQWTAAMVGLIVLAACGEEPTPPRLIGFVPADPSVSANETIDIEVTYEANDFKLDAFEWTAEAGEIEGNGKPKISYRAPETAGDYKLTVATTAVQDGLPDLTLDTLVKVLPAPEPAVSPGPEVSEARSDEESASSAGQKAAAEARAALQGATSQATDAGKEVAEEAEAGIESATQQVNEATREAPEAAQGQTKSAPQVAATAGVGTEPASARKGTQEQGAAAVAANESSKTTATVPPEEATSASAGTPSTTGTASSGAASGTASETTKPEAGETVAALTEGSAPGAKTSDGVGTIVDRGRLTAAVLVNFLPFSFADEAGRRVGFDVDLMHEFARRWLGDGDAVTFVPVTSDQRLAALEQGRADLLAAALTKTPAREHTIDFSETYFKDGQRLLVAQDADIAGPCDLAGKKVAVIAGTTSLDNIKAEASRCGFDIEEDLVVFDTHGKAVEALLNGEVAAFTSDGIALEHLAEGKPLKVVGNHFSEEPYGIGIAKGDDRLRRLVDLTLEEMAKDGTFAAIYQKWFGDALSPYPLQGAQGLSGDQQLMALATTDLPPLFAPAPDKAPVGDYVVRPGDTLSTIAGKLYGGVSPGAWRAIYDANKAAIGSDPNRIKVGMRLTLPSSL